MSKYALTTKCSKLEEYKNIDNIIPEKKNPSFSELFDI